MSDGPAPSPAAFDPDAFRSRLDHLARTLAEEEAAGSRRLATVGRLARRLASHLERPFRLAVIGEANVGKTTLVNRLLGQDLLATDVIANTRIPVIVRFAPTPGVAVVGPEGDRRRIEALPVDRERLAVARRLELSLPLPGLQSLELIDMPPLEADGDRRQLADRLDGKPDIVLWLTLATQAWRASELQIWRRLEIAPERALLVATHADLLADADRPRVFSRLEREAGAAFSAVVLAGDGACATGFDQISTAIDAVARGLDADRCRRAANALRRRLDRFAPEALSRL